MIRAGGLSTHMLEVQQGRRTGLKDYDTASQYWREEHQTTKSILNSLQALLASMALRKKGKKNKPFSDAVMLSVMDPGH